MYQIAACFVRITQDADRCTPEAVAATDLNNEFASWMGNNTNVSVH